MIYLYAIASAFVWVHVLRSPGIKQKPFTCDVCLAGWLGMILSYTSGHIWQVPFDGCAAMLGVILLKHHLKVN